MSTEPKPNDECTLRETLKANPGDWDARKKLAHLLYDQGAFPKAADVIWSADEIPGIDMELAFAARILAKAAPRKSIRLLTALLDLNRGKAVQNLGLANALLHHGMVLQAARFYGAAMEADPSLGNPDLEHFILWTDDEESLWGDFQGRRPKLGDLPWMKRDPKEAMELTSRIKLHTTPIKLPTLEEGPNEELKNELYQQKAEKGADISPPPAVTIPMDRVAPKDRLFDEKVGAPDAPALPVAAPVRKELPQPDFAAASGPPTKPVLPAASVPGGGPPTKPLPAATLPGGGPPTKVPLPPIKSPAATVPLAPPTAPASPTGRPPLPPLKKPDVAKQG